MMMMNTEEEEEELIPVCWSELPFDLVAQIADKVMSFSLSDYIRFGAVCYPWRSFLLQDYYYEHIKLPNRLPVLLIPSLNNHNNYQKQAAVAAAATSAEQQKKKKEAGYNDKQQQQQQQEEEEGDFLNDFHDYYNPREVWLGLNHEQRHQSTRSFYSILDKKVYDYQLPIPSYLNCRGSSHGWLVVVEECIDGTYPVHLLNPFRSNKDNNNKIHLPPLTSSDPSDQVYHSYFIDKAILSADPSSSILSNPTTTTTTSVADDELVVLCMCGFGRLRFCRPGDTSWTLLTILNYGSGILNLICYRGQFWIVFQNGRAVAFDISPLLPKPNVTTIIDPPLDDDAPYSGSRYLVESAGNLFQVRRDIIYLGDDDDDEKDSRYSTGGFHVFKLDPASMEWVKTNSLDGYMFFLGDNQSISLSASDYYFSGGGGGGLCKPNSIYFTDDNILGYGCRPGADGPHDMGVFNLDDGSFERFEPYYTVDSRNIMPAPIWIQPML